MSQFIASRGLCASISAMYRNDAAMEIDLILEIQKQFEDAGMCSRYPFNVLDYKRRAKHKTMHLCPARLQWAFDHWNTPPEGQSKELTEFYRAWYSWASSENGVPHGYAIYHADGTRTRCTKAQYEAAKVRNKPWHVEVTTDPAKI